MDIVFHNNNEEKRLYVNFSVGADGKDGIGVPAGGTKGQVLAKKSAGNGDTEWVTVQFPEGVQSDWNEQSPASPAYIKNKPTNLATTAYVDEKIGYISKGLSEIIGG